MSFDELVLIMGKSIDELTDEITDEVIRLAKEAGMLMPPLDKEGETICIGDTVSKDGNTYKVISIELCESGWLINTRTADMRSGLIMHRPEELSHVKPDTFEKVISEAVMTAVEGCKKGDAIGIEISGYVERCERIAEELK